jgi:hypothetical protein
MSNAGTHRIAWFAIPVSDRNAAARVHGAMRGYEP